MRNQNEVILTLTCCSTYWKEQKGPYITNGIILFPKTNKNITLTEFNSTLLKCKITLFNKQAIYFLSGLGEG